MACKGRLALSMPGKEDVMEGQSRTLIQRGLAQHRPVEPHRALKQQCPTRNYYKKWIGRLQNAISKLHSAARASQNAWKNGYKSRVQRVALLCS